MASRFISPVYDAGSGVKPSSGAKLSFFETGTSTPKDTFTTAAADVPNSNPVISDSNGVFPDIFISGTYKVILTDKNDIQVGFGEADPITEVSTVDSTDDHIDRLNPATLATWQFDTSSQIGDVVVTKERRAGIGGGATGDIIAGTGTANGFNIIAHNSLPQSFVLRTGEILNVLQWGTFGDDTNDDRPAIQAAEDFARPLKRKVFFPEPSVGYRINAPLIGGTFTNWEGEGRNNFIIKHGNTTSGLPTRIAPERPAVNDVMDVDAVLIIDHADSAFAIHIDLKNLYFKDSDLNSTAVEYGVYNPRTFFYNTDGITCDGTDNGFFSFVAFQTTFLKPYAVNCATAGFKWSDDGTGGGSGTSVVMTRPYAQGCGRGYDIFGLVYSHIDTPSCDSFSDIGYFFTSNKALTVTSLGMENQTTGTHGILVAGSRMTFDGINDFNTSPSSTKFEINGGSRVTLNEGAFTDFTTPASAFNLEVSTGSHLITNNTQFPTNGNSFVSYSGGSTRVDTNSGIVTLTDAAGSQSINSSDVILTDANTGVLAFGNAAPAGGSNTVQIGDTAGILYLARVGTITTAVASFINDNGAVGAIQTSGTSTIFLTSSDPRLKSEFTPFDPIEAWERFDALLAGSGKFHFLADPTKEVWGFNAHGLIDAGLDIGSEGEGPRGLAIGDTYKDAVLDEEENVIEEALIVTPAGIDQSKGLPYLVAVIDDLRNRLIELESK